MCYSAMVWQAFRDFEKVHGAIMDIKSFADLYGFQPEPRKRKTPKAMDANFAEPRSAAEAQIKAVIEEGNRLQVAGWEADLFAQRRRLADAERTLATKETKKALNDQRIAGNKVKQLLGWLEDAKRTAPKERDSRIYPNHYAPVMIWEGGRRVVKPMRYLLRRAGKAAKEDDMYPGCYNARRDNLEKFWKAQFGATHGVMIVTEFFENVSRHALEGRPLAPNEHEENVILKFTPKPPEPMIIACLWSHWTAPGAQDLLSFAAITDEPPPEVAAAGHDRCIIQIKAENIDEWLQPNGNLKRMQEILDDRPRPYYEHRLAA